MNERKQTNPLNASPFLLGDSKTDDKKAIFTPTAILKTSWSHRSVGLTNRWFELEKKKWFQEINMVNARLWLL